jgi:hypothetical protein
MILPVRICSSAWAVQPRILATAKVAATIAGEILAASNTRAA